MRNTEKTNFDNHVTQITSVNKLLHTTLTVPTAAKAKQFSCCALFLLVQSVVSASSVNCFC